MKKMIGWLLAAVLFVNVLPLSGNAAETELATINFDDGSYMTVEIITSETRASGSKTGAKQYTYYDSSSVAQWKAVLTGTFTYTGSSATCTSSSMDVTIYDSSWYVISKSSSKSGSKAIGSAIIGEKTGVTSVAKIPVNLTLTCDANGNLS